MGILRTELGFRCVSTVGTLGYLRFFLRESLCAHPPTHRGRFPIVTLIPPGEARNNGPHPFRSGPWNQLRPRVANLSVLRGIKIFKSHPGVLKNVINSWSMFPITGIRGLRGKKINRLGRWKTKSREWKAELDGWHKSIAGGAAVIQLSCRGGRCRAAFLWFQWKVTLSRECPSMHTFNSLIPLDVYVSPSMSRNKSFVSPFHLPSVDL